MNLRCASFWWKTIRTTPTCCQEMLATVDASLEIRHVERLGAGPPAPAAGCADRRDPLGPVAAGQHGPGDPPAGQRRGRQSADRGADGHGRRGFGRRGRPPRAQDYLVKGEVGARRLLQAIRHAVERKEMERAVRDHEARLAGLVASAMDAIIAIDVRQQVVLFNPAAETMFGCKAADALGGSLERFIPARFRQAHRTQVERFGATGADQSPHGGAVHDKGAAGRRRGVSHRGFDLADGGRRSEAVHGDPPRRHPSGNDPRTP